MNVGYKILHGKIYIKIDKLYRKILAIITSPKVMDTMGQYLTYLRHIFVYMG